MGAKAILHVLRNYEQLSASAIPQPTEGATKAPKIHANSGKITWSDMTAQVRKRGQEVKAILM